VRNETVVKTAEANSFYNSTMTTFSWQATKIRPMGEYFLETKSQIWKKQGKKDERRLGKSHTGGGELTEQLITRTKVEFYQ